MVRSAVVSRAVALHVAERALPALHVAAVVDVVADREACDAEQEDEEVEADAALEAFGVLEVVGGGFNLVDDGGDFRVGDSLNRCQSLSLEAGLTTLSF